MLSRIVFGHVLNIGLLSLLPLTNSFASGLKLGTKEKLFNLRREIRSWAAECEDGSLTAGGECPFGDMAIFAGLSCLSGEEKRCDDLKRSQGESGEWFRSPGMVDAPFIPGGWATFSRDQSRGAMAYLIKTRDTEAAEKWFQFIKRNKWRLCPKSDEGNDACATRMTFWPTFGIMWDYLGMPRNKKINKLHYFFERTYKPIEVNVQPQNYPMHLSASTVYLRREIEKRTGRKDRNSKHLDRVTRILHRRAPQNPFFRFLAKGRDERTALLVLNYCPAEEPATVHRDWIWQRSIDDVGHIPGIKTWKRPMGHDCIFMINLLIGPDSEQIYTAPKVQT